jgi:hypothetical protein
MFVILLTKPDIYQGGYPDHNHLFAPQWLDRHYSGAGVCDGRRWHLRGIPQWLVYVIFSVKYVYC